MSLIKSLLIVAFVFCQTTGSNLKIWETSGFEGFRQGDFGSGGSNLYVSKKGTVQTINRFDLNQDGYFDLLFASTHDRIHMVPAYQYRFKERSRKDYGLFQYPGVGGFRVVATDLNGDGMPELIIGRGDDNTTPNLNTWIYWGTKDGWNERFHSELLTPNLRDLCVGDLNNDSKPDLIIAGSSNVTIYWGHSDGLTYQNRSVVPATNLNSCLVADVDGDLQNDLVISAANKTSKVIWGRANGVSLDEATILPVDHAIGASKLGSRLIIATPKGPVILAVSSRRFSLSEELNYPAAGRLAVSDLNGDHISDLVVTRLIANGSYETTSRIYWGIRKNSLEAYSDSSFTDLQTLGAVDVAVVDVDSDGFQDILFANSRDNASYSVSSYIYWGGARGYTVGNRTELPTHGAQSVSVNGTDVFFANNVIMRRRGDADSYVYLGNKDGLYSQNSLIRLPTIGAYEGCISDLNDDGFADVLITNSYEDSPEEKGGSPIFWGGRNGLSPTNRTMVQSRTGIGCAVADLDKDGYLDLLITNYTEDTASIFFGNSEGSYKDREQILKVRDGRFPAIADLNKDNYLDLIIPSVKDGLYIFWGNSDGYHQEKHTRLPGLGAVSQQIADLDGNGYLDIVLCNLYDEQNRIFSGINSFVYWGSPAGYSPIRRLDIPSFGGTHATIADYNRDCGGRF